MTTSAEARVHATVVLGPVSRDLAVPEGATVAEVLARLRVDVRSRAVLVTDSSGWRVAADDVIGVDVPDGAVLTVSRGSAGASVLVDEFDRARAVPPGADSAAVLAGSGVLLVGVALLHLQPGRALAETLPGWWRPAVVAILAVAVLVLLLRRARPRTVLVDLAALSAVAVTAGVLLVPPEGEVAVRLLLVVGPAVAGAVLALRAALAERRRDRSASSAALVAGVWLAGAVLALLTLQLGTDAGVVAAVALGAVPPLLLAMPELAIDVPDDQLLDLAHVRGDAGGVRSPRPRPPAEVTGPRVLRVVSSARRRQDMVVLLLCLLAVVTTPPVLRIAADGGIRGWAAAATVGLTLLCLMLVPRTARSRTVRVVPRLAACAMLAIVAWAAVLGGRAQAMTLGVAVVLAALAVAGLAIAVGKGFRNVAVARVGDIVQGLATYLALPAGVVAAGAIQWVRQVGL